MRTLLLIAITSVLAGGAFAQAGYQQTNLVADTPGIASKVDSQLINPWGIAVIPGQPVWIANNNSGTSTLYLADGSKDSLVVSIPTASVNPCQQGCPTGLVSNTSADFGGAQFIFDTEDGLIVSWIQGAAGTIAVDNSPRGAIYKGLALLNRGSSNVLLAANFQSGKIEVYDRNFQLSSLAGSFTDPNLPANFAPFSVHIIGTSIYIAYAQKDSNQDPVLGAGVGVVDTFDQNGNFVGRFASGGSLNAPWGVAVAPANFGKFSNDILVGNFGDGAINAFDQAGNFLGQLSDVTGKAIVNPGLWELQFAVFGDPQTLYLTAGGADENHGLFAKLVSAQSVSTGDFALSVSPNNITTNLGGSAAVTVTASAMGTFSGDIALSCSGLPAGVTCAFSPQSITPGSGSATSSLTVSVSQQGYQMAMARMGPWSGLFVFGLTLLPLASHGRRRKIVRYGSVFLLLLVVTSFFLIESGCGSSNSNHKPTGNAQQITISGASGSIVHSTQASLTVN